MGFLLRFCDRAERCVYEWLYACIGRLHLFHFELSNLQQRNGVAVFHNIKKHLTKFSWKITNKIHLKKKNYLNEKKTLEKSHRKTTKWYLTNIPTTSQEFKNWITCKTPHAKTEDYKNQNKKIFRIKQVFKNKKKVQYWKNTQNLFIAN